MHAIKYCIIKALRPNAIISLASLIHEAASAELASEVLEMKAVTNILYTALLGCIRVWRLLTFGVIWIFFKPIKARIIKLLSSAGVTVNGKEPHDVRVRNDMLYHRIAHEGSLGLGEAYMEGWWDSDSVDELFTKLLRFGLMKHLLHPGERLINYLQFHVFNLQTAAKSWEVAEKHYNLGNHLFSSFLDSSMNYSCGYWKDASNLDEAQQHKMELIGRKLRLRPGMRVLDIGCGWGGLCKFLAERYNVQVVGITNSKEGAKTGRERCKGLDVEIRVGDYRDLNEGFDRIVSVGMFEHVGRQNYRTFFEIADRCLVEDGIFLLHTIGIDNNYIFSIEPFTNKYIFPNGILPDHKNIPESIDNLFTIEDWHNFGQYYDKTLMAWHANFVKNWSTISHLFENPEKFYRMWTFYLLFAAAGFRSRKFQLWQIVLTKKGLPGGYVSVR